MLSLICYIITSVFSKNTCPFVENFSQNIWLFFLWMYFENILTGHSGKRGPCTVLPAILEPFNYSSRIFNYLVPLQFIKFIKYAFLFFLSILRNSNTCLYAENNDICFLAHHTTCTAVDSLLVSLSIT